MYRTLDLPGQNPLRDAHDALDGAVMEAYGFSRKGDLLAKLLELNLRTSDAEVAEQKVTAPGIPPDFPNPETLITDDCIAAP